MIKKIWSAIKYYIFIAVGILMVWLVFRDVNLGSVLEEMKSANPGWLLASFCFGIIAMLSRAIRWRILLEPLGYKPSTLNCYNGVSMGYFANTAVPRMGEIVRCSVVSQTDRIPLTELIGTVVLERVIDVIMLFSLIILVVFSQMERFGDFFINEVLGKKLEESGILNFVFQTLGWWLILIIPFAIMFGIVAIRWLFRKYGDKKPVKKVSQFFNGITNGFAALFKMKKRGAFLFHTFFIWLNYYFMTWICIYAYEPTSHLGAFDGLFLMVVGGLGMTAPAPGGIGPFHLFVSKALLIYGLSQVQGIAFATLVHTTQFIMIISSGIFSLTVLYIIKKKKNATQAS